MLAAHFALGFVAHPPAGRRAPARSCSRATVTLGPFGAADRWYREHSLRIRWQVELAAAANPHHPSPNPTSPHPTPFRLTSPRSASPHPVLPHLTAFRLASPHQRDWPERIILIRHGESLGNTDKVHISNTTHYHTPTTHLLQTRCTSAAALSQP